VRKVRIRSVAISSNECENQDGLTKEALVREKWKWLGEKKRKKKKGMCGSGD